MRVGDSNGGDLLRQAESPPTIPDPRLKKVRRRPNNGRTKRTNRNPPLTEPPWDLLRELGIPLPPLLANLPHLPSNWRRGPYYAQWRIQVHAMWGDLCHICGHPEAHSADHLVPLSVWPNQPYEPMLARPAHGVIQPDGTEGCPTCYVKCNSSRGNRQLANLIRNYKPTIQL